MARKKNGDAQEGAAAKRTVEEIQAELRNTPAQEHPRLLAELAEAQGQEG